MKWVLPSLLLLCAFVPARADTSGATLENHNLAWHWRQVDGKIQPASLEDKLNGGSLKLGGECFELQLAGGKIVKASDCALLEPPKLAALAPEADSPVAANRLGGHQLVFRFVDAKDRLTADWRVVLRDDATYVREQLTLRAESDVLVKEVTLLNQPLPGAEVAGTVDGSPIVAGNFFLGFEHPMAQNTVGADGAVRCSFLRNAVLQNGETLKESLVLGTAQPGQLRRSFLAYLERERTHPYRTFLHYNSWFDIAWDKQKFNEAQSLNVIEQFGRELVTARGVRMDSFLFDDGWDDSTTLWQFHAGFPNGFARLKTAAAAYHSGIGVWISPFGGYDEARRRRLEFGSKQGYETNASGFSLAGPKYYQLFRDICREMIQKYGVNQFKFDGLAAGTKAGENGLTRDGDAMLQLVADLRATDPNLYINQTTGTWPSPFWLLNVDSTWRGGDDHNFQGPGSWCQQWMTYRDVQTHVNVVKRAPLYPLNSLMLHGVIYATNASHLQAMSDEDFAGQVRAFFGTGTQLQELYLTPGLLNRQNWDDLAEAANWSRRNADVLVDTHWIGGDPAKGEVYGWAAWSPRLGIVTLRNPTGKPLSFAADLKTLFELPPEATGVFALKSPWKIDAASVAEEISTVQPHLFKLRPFEVLTLEAKPVAGGDRAADTVLGASATIKHSTIQ
ncbi:MAG: enterotoxin [Verrucomicrobiae bacterium]|nr:enterotoxin [Verrucomicrobiae bacterium]